ncbi:metalloregulator ArsR/SmtB family transcription factor [Fusibacter bizertensis]|uniref:Metalloregulator ArsR/SmtB family transcription factor n=1 Tax=Fusibacter bizertensis TaxID=1488331 RepID=A0ABT6NCY8_9FIRM|nr:metalloregulator ArsR/SmtB family transcription factor [Fusibacter bizertensis]MDH8678251.1 metalloregulator ArsR/SmtB family transcription factor [Fusibacter bizertensis]
MEDAIKLFKALSDASRVRIINSLIDAPKYVELLAERLELTPSTVSFHLKKLEDVGLVTKHKDQYYIIYEICNETLNQTLENLVKSTNSHVAIEDAREQEYRQKVIDTFFKFEKLKSIPVQRKKRMIILEKMVEAFKFDEIYTEKEVNIIIADFHDDFATLRRELINEKLMKRDNGIYQRIK